MRFKFRVPFKHVDDIRQRLRELRSATNSDEFLGHPRKQVRLVGYDMQVACEERSEFYFNISFAPSADAKTFGNSPEGSFREISPGVLQNFDLLELRPFGPLLAKLREVGEEIVDDSDQCDED